MALVSRLETALTSLKDTFLTEPERALQDGEVACLCRLDRDLCRALLCALQDVKFLVRDGEGSYRLARRSLCDDEPAETPSQNADARRL